MRIIFKVNKVDYLLKNGTGDVLLYRYFGQKEKEDGTKTDLTKFVGSFRNTFMALEYIVTDQEQNNDITEILELKEMYKTVLSEVREIAKQLKLS